MKQDYADKLTSEERFASLPEEAKAKLKKRSYRHRFTLTFFHTIWLLPFAATLIILAAVVFLPIYKIYGGAMSPTLYDGNMVALSRTKTIENGELVAFYYNNKVLVRRVIAQGGQEVIIDKNGNVSVDGEELNEMYLGNARVGKSEIKYPYTVPEDQLFVLGDERDLAVDSRTEHFGCVTKGQIVGKVLVRFWPLNTWKLFN